MCNDPISAHCSTDKDKMHFSLPCVALQNRVTSCWCHFKYTFVYSSTYRFQCPITTALQHWLGRNAFLIAQSCSAKQADSIAVSSPMHYSTLSKQNAFLTAQTCSAKQADSRLVSLQIDLWVFAQHTCLQCLTTNALQHWSK